MFRRSSLHIICFLLFVLTLAGCSSDSTTTPLQAKTSPTFSRVSSPSASTTSSPLVFPSNCSSTILPGVKVFPWYNQLSFVGRSPVWAQIPQNLQIPGMNGGGFEPGTKILWEVGPNFSLPVKVQVTNLKTRKLAGWGNGTQPPTTFTNELQRTSSEYHGSPAPNWNEWGGFLYLPTAGCYQMNVTWRRGEWSVVFAVAIENVPS